MCNGSTLNAEMSELATATFPGLSQSPLSINQNWSMGVPGNKAKQIA